MKKVVAFVLTLGMVCALGFGAVGCGKKDAVPPAADSKAKADNKEADKKGGTDNKAADKKAP